MGQQHHRPRVVAHQRQTFTRIVQIERHIGRAAGQHAEQRDQRVHRARNADGDHVFGADAAFDQHSPQLHHPFGELPVAEAHVAAGHRQRLGLTLNLALERIHDRNHARRRRQLSAAPPGRELSEFPLADQRQLTVRLVRLPRQLLQPMADALRVVLQGARRVFGRVGDQRQRQYAASKTDLELQVVDRPHRQRMGGGRLTVERQGAVVDLDIDHRPVQFLMAADQAEIAFDLLRLIALMATRLLDLRHGGKADIRQRHLRRHVQQQRQHVDHRADRRQRLRPHPAHERKTD